MMSVNLSNAITRSQSASDSLPSPPARYLDWTQRSDSLQDFISDTLERLSSQTTSNWGSFGGMGFNGQENYGMCGVHEYALMKKIIQQAPSSQKDFYALDIGAGNFQWSKGLADFLDKQTDLPKDIKVHIIGIRGEKHLGQRIIETDRCKIYNLGAFKIEELFRKLKKEEGLPDLEGKIDLAVSRWTFRHLADPTGTFVQVFNLLRPKTGFLLMDGFYLDVNDSINTDGNINMTRLFLDTKAPFLTRFYGDTRSLNHFMLRRPDANPCQLPMNYDGRRYAEETQQIGSRSVTCFTREAQPGDEEKFYVPIGLPEDYDQIHGDRKMLDWLRKNGLMNNPCLIWAPIQNKDRGLKSPPLHQAVLRGDLHLVKECLNRGDDIDESDADGNTALHLAIQKKSYDLFQLLIEKGAHLWLANRERHTSLHEAAAIDTEGRFLQTLLDKAIAANISVDDGYLMDKENFFFGQRRPLQSAIRAKNRKGVEILIKAGAKLSEWDRKELKDPAFSPPQKPEETPPPKTGRGGLADIASWIKEGHCVVLHYNGYEGIMYYHPTASNKSPKLVQVDINPNTGLLEKDELPAFLKEEGYDYIPYDQEKTQKGKFASVSNLRFGY